MWLCYNGANGMARHDKAGSATNTTGFNIRHACMRHYSTTQMGCL